MQTEPTLNNNNSGRLVTMDTLKASDIVNVIAGRTGEFKSLFEQFPIQWMHEMLAVLTTQHGKKNFLVFKSNKYINIHTDNIAFFYIRYESAMIMCFDKQEYFVKYSLDQIQNLLPEKQFYRLNRQYLINFNAVKEVEHYFARKLLVNPVIPMKDKLIVSKEKVTEFLHWLDNR